MVNAAKGPRFDKVRMLEDEEDYSFPDRDFLAFARERGVEDVDDYGIVHPTLRNFTHALGQSDKKETWNLDPVREKMAWRALKHHFSGHFGKYRKLPYERIECIPDTSPGFPWGHRFKTKEDALRAYPSWFEYYLQDGVDRPVPIYKVTPKSEYLTKEEIASNKIRLFRNPPLDFLLLQTKYFGDMETGLAAFTRQTKSALGFSKEHGGWQEFVKDLSRFHWYHRHDVGYFDKSFGRRLKEICYRLRRKMYHPDEVIDDKDWQFLLDGETYSYELMPNGQIFATLCGGKSGNLTTSTDNTIAHIFIMLYHLTKFFKTLKDLNAFVDECWAAYIYSDDIQGSTDYPIFFSEAALIESVSAFGMRVKDYCLSRDVTSIHFLGAANIRFKGRFVPKYDEDRMLYALGNLAGKHSREVRAQRIHGLAKNLAFSNYCPLVCAFAAHLAKIGEWPSTVPLPTVYKSQKLFMRWESLWRMEGNKRNFIKGQPQTMEKIVVEPLPQRPPRPSRSERRKQRSEIVVKTATPGKAARPPRKPSVVREPGKIPHVVGGRDPRRIEYLRALVDPESVSEIRYPDNLAKATSTFKGIMNPNVYYFPDDTCEPQGTYLNFLSPTMIDPLFQYQLQSVDTDHHFTMVVQQQNESQGLFPLSVGDASINVTSSTMSLKKDGSTVYNINGKYGWTDQKEALPGFLGHNTTGASTAAFYGFPINAGLATRIDFLVNTDARAAATGPSDFQVRAITSTVVGAWQTLDAVSGSTLYSLSQSPVTLFAGMANASGYIPAPGVGFQIRSSASTNFTAGVSSIRIEAVFSTGLQPRFVNYPLPDNDTLARDVDQYRVVSMSNWLEYEGSDLNNGGQHAGIMYRGGQSPLTNGLYSYSQIAVTPGGYQGALKLGSYSFWLPSNQNDMLMRRLNADTRWEYPYIVLAGIVATTSQVNSLRMRIFINYEFISSSQLYTHKYPRPDPSGTWIAMEALKTYPTTMENPFHWKTIKKILGEVGDLAKGAYGIYKDNASWINPAVAGALTLL